LVPIVVFKEKDFRTRHPPHGEGRRRFEKILRARPQAEKDCISRIPESRPTANGIASDREAIMTLTREQSALLSAAIRNPDHILITSSDSPNDFVWRALVDRGTLEAIKDISDPALRNIIHLCDLRAYRVTEHVAARAADFRKAYQHAGRA
jgi:hypothetical protein